MPLDREFLEVAQEIRQEEVSDVHAVDVGIGGEHDPVVPQSVDAVLEPERAHHVVELFVLVDRIPLQTVTVEGLASQ